MGGGSSKKNKAERKERSVVSFREKLCNDVLTHTSTSTNRITSGGGKRCCVRYAKECIKKSPSTNFRKNFRKQH